MKFKNILLTLAALGLSGTVLAASPAMAQEHGGRHGSGGGHAGGDNRGGGHGGGGNHAHDGHSGGGDRGGRGYRGGHPEWGGALGYYAGYPWYCREHRHWRWSNRRQAYVYSTRGGYC